MAIPYEKIVAEDIRTGLDSAQVQVTMPGGGQALGTPVNLGTFKEGTGETYAALPAASAFKGGLRTVNNSTTKTPGATVSGGGSYFVLVWSNGTNWVVVTG